MCGLGIALTGLPCRCPQRVWPMRRHVAPCQADDWRRAVWPGFLSLPSGAARPNPGWPFSTVGHVRRTKKDHSRALFQPPQGLLTRFPARLPPFCPMDANDPNTCFKGQKRSAVAWFLPSDAMSGRRAVQGAVRYLPRDPALNARPKQAIGRWKMTPSGNRQPAQKPRYFPPNTRSSGGSLASLE